MQVNHHGVVNKYKVRMLQVLQKISSTYFYIFMQSNTVLARVWGIEAKGTLELQMTCGE